MKKEIFEWIKTIVIAVVIAVVITTFIKPLQVDGISMYPTLHDRDYLILENTSHVQKGDIISFKSDIPFSKEELSQFNFFKRFKLGDTKNLIKRVIATPGDNLLIEKGKVFVNGQPLDEQYINGNFTFGDIHVDKIPKGKIFVMGDNRDHSLDSRKIGLVDIDRIQGKVLIRVLPFSQFGNIK